MVGLQGPSLHFKDHPVHGMHMGVMERRCLLGWPAGRRVSGAACSMTRRWSCPLPCPAASCLLAGDPFLHTNRSADPSLCCQLVASPKPGATHCRRGRVRRAHVCPDRRSLQEWAAAPARLVSAASVGLPACCPAHALPPCSGYAMGCWTCLAESVNLGLCSSACPQGGAILGCAGRAGRAARHDCTCCPTHLSACRCSPPTLHPVPASS